MNQKAMQLSGSVLYIDSDRSNFEIIESKVKNYGLKIEYAGGFESALYLFNSKKFEVCIVDAVVADMPGTVIIQKFRQITKGDRHLCGFIATYGQNCEPYDLRGYEELGNIILLPKPLEMISLRKALIDAKGMSTRLKAMDDAKENALTVYAKTHSVEEMLRSVELAIPENAIDQFTVKSSVLDDRQQYEKGIEVIDELLKVEPHSISYNNQKAKFLLRLSRNEEAMQILANADAINPNHLERIAELAQLYLDNGNPDESAKKMQQLIDFNPEFKNLKFQFFKDLNNAGFQEFAINLCKSNCSPKEIVAYYNNRGVIHSQSGAVDHALKEYYMALLVFPTYRENYRIYFNIALAEARKKTPHGVRKSWEAVNGCLAIRSDFSKAQKLKARLESVVSPLVRRQFDGAA